MLVSGCGATALIEPEKSVTCAGWERVDLSDAAIDAMTDADVQAVDDHNRYGAKWECWNYE